MSASHPERDRITLIEVIVVTLILALVVLLLLPAVEKVRNGEPYTYCLNNLKQMALACHTYHTTRKGKLPTGTIHGSAKEPEDRLSLMVLLLPYLEQEALYKEIDRGQGWQAERNSHLVARPVPVYMCLAVGKRDEGRHHFTDYVGLAGVGEEAASLPVGHPRAGVFGYDRQLNVSEIADGLSQTLLFAETRKGAAPWAAGGRSTLRGIDPADAHPFSAGGGYGNPHQVKRGFWRSEHGATPIALADGSARMVNAGVSGEVLAALATVAGREEVPSDW